MRLHSCETPSVFYALIVGYRLTSNFAFSASMTCSAVSECEAAPSVSDRGVASSSAIEPHELYDSSDIYHFAITYNPDWRAVLDESRGQAFERGACLLRLQIPAQA